LIFKTSSSFNPFVFESNSISDRTAPIRILMGLVNPGPSYPKATTFVLASVSETTSGTLEHPKNWLSVLDVYVTRVGVPATLLTTRVPVVPNPTVESTSRIVDPAETAVMTLVFGWTLKSTKNDPNTLMSLSKS